MLKEDRTFIENKYHDTSKPYNAYDRMGYHGWTCDERTGLSDDEMKKELAAFVEREEKAGKPHPVIKAEAAAYVLDNGRFDISPHDYFVYFYSWGRLTQPSTHHRWDREVFSEKIPDTRRTMDRINQSGAVAQWPDYDHVVPNWDSLLTLGFPGLLARSEKCRKKHEAAGTLTEEREAVYDSIKIEYEAVLHLLSRMQKFAEQKAKEGQEKAADIAACLDRLESGAPQTLYDALQAIYLFFIVCECVDCFQTRSLGNGIDNTLLPFYRADLESGRYTKEELSEFLGYFFLQYAAIDNYWGHPMYLGGTDKNGNSVVNELTYEILRVYRKLGIYNPKIQIKVNRNSPKEYIETALDMVRSGNSSLVFCCEPGMVKAIMNYGVPYEKAYDFDISGCYETRVRSDESSTGTGYVNVLKAVRYVFTRGADETTKERVGLDTGALSEMKSFSDFYGAFLKQWRHLIETSFACADAYEPYLSYVNPCVMFTATSENSVERGVDGYTVGMRYNNSNMLCCSFGTAVDALMAVREFVYEKKTVTLEEMASALEENWEGYEELRTTILKSPHKYGNGDYVTDEFASALARFYCSIVNNRPNKRGGVYKAIMHSAMQFIWQGDKTGATPDGRRNGDEISKNASPTPGMDKNGVTALLRSATGLVPYLFSESFCVDVMLHPSAVEGNDGMTVLKGLLTYYLEHGGMSIQFNVMDTKTLRDAQKHPEKYRNLQVRVCGWNVLWNSLSEQEQNAYIRRAENIQ